MVSSVWCRVHLSQPSFNYKIINVTDTRWNSFKGGSARRKATETEETRIHIHVSGRFEPMIPVFDRAKSFDALGHSATVISLPNVNCLNPQFKCLCLKERLKEFKLSLNILRTFPHSSAIVTD